MCQPIGHPFREDSNCFQLFECRQPDGTITYKKEPSTCPPRPRSRYVYPVYPFYAYPLPPAGPYELTVERKPAKTTIETVAPYAIGTVAIAGVLYLAGVFG